MSKARKRFLILTLTAFVAAAGISTAVYAAGAGSDNGVPAAGGRNGGDASIAISNCKTPKSDFITNDTTGLGTTSVNYVAVPGMTKNVFISGTVPSCLIVDVSAYAFATGSALEFVSVALDGGLVANPSEVQFAGDSKGVWAEQHAAVFAFPNVSPGNHSVALVFKSFDGKQVFLHRPAMEIEHK
jgi:hypothetical protein